jgi:hypothetical protein
MMLGLPVYFYWESINGKKQKSADYADYAD